MKPKISNRWPLRIVESFFNSWNPEMAYILGYFASDGTMYKNKRGSCYIAFTSTDKELIILVKNILKASNKVEVYQAKNKRNWKIRYTLQIGSKRIFARLLELGFTPNKSLTLGFPPIPDDLLGHFIRGYFDGDGCASFACYKRKNRKVPQKILSIRISCGSKDFITILQNKLIKVVPVGRGYLYLRDRTYDLVYSSKDVLKLYSFLYPSKEVPCLERKREILSRGLQVKFNM